MGRVVATLALISVSSLVLVSDASRPQAALAWGSANTEKEPLSAHYFIINRAIDLIRQEGRLDGWPLESYAADINFGAWYADYNPLRCNFGGTLGHIVNWTAGEEVSPWIVCDSVHHFYTAECLELTDVFWRQCMGGGGDLDGVGYAEDLHRIARRLWPSDTNTERIDIHSLRFLDNGGFFRGFSDGGMNFGPFVVGAQPYAFQVTAIANDFQEVGLTEWAYTWPYWTDGTPDERAANRYLGWAIHMIEDMSVVFHAKNETGSEHANYERITDEYLVLGLFDHLPIREWPHGEYQFYADYFAGSRYSSAPLYFDENWTIRDYADEAAMRAISSYDEPDRVDLGGHVEHALDTSIKLVAAIIDDFYGALELEHDRFEPNDFPSEARELTHGLEEGLTVHAPFDDDVYRFVGGAQDSVRISVRFDQAAPMDRMGFGITIRNCDTCPSYLGNYQVVDGGITFEDSSPSPGRIYEFTISSRDQRPFTYDLLIEDGFPPKDRFEPNDTLETATMWSNLGCDYSGTLTIDHPSDEDIIAITAPPRDIAVLAIPLDPTAGIDLWYGDGVSDWIVKSGTGAQSMSIPGGTDELTYLKVAGTPTRYQLCLTTDTTAASRLTDDGWTAFVANGLFEYSLADPFLPPGSPTEFSGRTSRVFYVRPSPDSTDPGAFQLYGVIDYGYDIYQAVFAEISIDSSGQVSASTIVISEGEGTRPRWVMTDATDVSGSGSASSGELHELQLDITQLQWSEQKPAEVASLTLRLGTDSDADGLSDQLELMSATDPFAADTDGDGLLDGVEDANANGRREHQETDPTNPDTDADGLSDGLEVGLRFSAVGAPIDADPATTTDPVLADTDGDGVSDGAEDVNRNGRHDDGETSPLVAPSTQDADGDGNPDHLDNCPNVSNSIPTDTDGDGIGDACDGMTTPVEDGEPTVVTFQILMLETDGWW